MLSGYCCVFTDLYSQLSILRHYIYPVSFLDIIYIYTLLVCLFVSNKRQNGRTDRPKFVVKPCVTTGKVRG